MINLDDIRGRSALTFLENYSGINPYLKKLKSDYAKNPKLKLTEVQNKYIVENHEKAPIFLNRVVGITTYLGEELQKQGELKFVPERILIEYLLAETEKTYHVYGKLKRNQVESRMYWLPKTQVLDDPYYEPINIEVDFTPWNNILAKDGKKLYKHQEDGIKFLLSRNGCILADDMGLGKSIQSIIAALESGAERILIVCPSNVKINWEREINVFHDSTQIIEGSRWPNKKTKFTIINFDILKNFHTLGDGKKKDPTDPVLELNRHLVNSKFDLVIVDEAHNLKNKKSIRGEIMYELAVVHNIERVWLLTGTPVANRPMDFFNLLKIIKAPIADNWKYFATRYCEGKKFFRTLKNGQKKQVWLTNGASNLDELANKTKNLLIRRLKTEVLDMPDKVVTPMYHQLDKQGWAEYDQLWEDYLIKRKKEKKKGEPDKMLVELILLRRFVALKAIPMTIELAENALEMDKKVIIFTNFTDELEELQEHFGDICVTHNGKLSDKEKQKSVDSFQNNPKIKIFIGNIKSAGVGITLTEGTVEIFNSFDWVPGNNEQAEDRAFRIGQKNNVNVYYQLFLDTVSTKMWEVLHNKKDVISTIMREKDLSDDEKEFLLTEQIFNDDEGSEDIQSA